MVGLRHLSAVQLATRPENLERNNDFGRLKNKWESSVADGTVFMRGFVGSSIFAHVAVLLLSNKRQ